MSEQEVIAAIRAKHLKGSIDLYERAGVVSWDRARVDPGGTIFGPGPYVKVPVRWDDEEEEIVIRVYAPAKLRRQLQAAISPTEGSPSA